MSECDLKNFDELTVRYLDGALDEEEFTRLQWALRASGSYRRRFLNHCLAAQECAEVADWVGVEAIRAEIQRARSVRSDRSKAPAGVATSPSWWRRNAAAFAAAAAAVLVLAIGFNDLRLRMAGQKAPVLAAGGQGMPESRASTAEAPRLQLVRISLVERPRPRFQLTPVARTAAAWWVNHGAELTPEPAIPSESDWLDGIGLAMVNSEPVDLDDIEL